jgi:O-antigen ligase
MPRSATLAGALSRRRLALAPPPRPEIDAIAGSDQRWPEKLFLGFAFLVLQGAFVGLAASIGTESSASSDGSDIQHMMAFVLLISGTMFFARKSLGEMWRAVGANLTYFVLPLIVVASVAWSVEPSLTLKRSILALAVCGFDLYVATTVGMDRILKFLSITISISAIASVFFALAIPTIGREVTEGLIGDWRGVFPQKNTFGQVMSIGVFVEMGLMIRARRPSFMGIVKVSLFMLLIMMAHSASSILSAVLAVIFSAFYLSFRHGSGSTIICALLTVGVSAIFLGFAGLDWSSVFDLLDRDPSLTGRTDLWVYIEEAIREKPLFGWGYMAFWTPDSNNVTYIQHQINWSAPNAHNGYLELALAVGIVGMGGLVVTGIWAFRRVALLIVQKNDLGALLLIISVQFIVANLTESSMINASVFGWNVFSIFGLKAGLALSQKLQSAHADIQPVSILSRAKPI